MKKTLIALSTVLAMSSASALDIGAGYTRNVSNDVNGYGINVGQTWKQLSLTAGATRFDVAGGSHDEVSLIAGYRLLKVMGISVEGQLGATYVTSDVAKDGLVSVLGLGVSMPVTKTVAVTANVRRNIGIDSMKVHDGTTAGLGLRYSF